MSLIAKFVTQRHKIKGAKVQIRTMRYWGPERLVAMSVDFEAATAVPHTHADQYKQ
jgi:hypothetical protein